jgi:hypothetical protein
VPILRERLLHEQLVAAQQRDRAQLGGGFNGEEIQGGAALSVDYTPRRNSIFMLLY